MTDLDKRYRCWFLINPTIQFRPYLPDENAAADTIARFLADKDYGKGISLLWFDIYVEPEINFGHHQDHIYRGCARLSAHIRYEEFVSANPVQRHKLLVNAALVLCKYLAVKVTLPKGFDAARLVQDYTDYLKENALLYTDEECHRLIVKPFEGTRFNFVITTTAEVKEEDIHYDLVQIQDYLANHLVGKTFGSSIRQFDFGYEIADFGGVLKPWAETANLRRYGTRYKNLLIVKQFDYRQLKGKTHREQFEILKAKILEAIGDVDQLKKKPKDFDKETFRSTIDELLTAYSEKYCR